MLPEQAAVFLVDADSIPYSPGLSVVVVEPSVQVLDVANAITPVFETVRVPA
jgi:hypothetical protein